MKELTLLADSRAPLAFHLETSAAVAHWNLRDVPGDHISLPALCDARLTEIRREHAAWACRTGLRPVEGALLHEHFQAGEKLSMWWCSLLYERHPKMTPLLYEIYKLRTLEHLLDEGGFTALRLVGGDEHDVLGLLPRRRRVRPQPPGVLRRAGQGVPARQGRPGAGTEAHGVL